MREEPSWEGSSSLCELAADPARLEALYEDLREFCHTFRNRLNLIQLSLYLARKSEGGCPERWDDLDGHYRAVERLMDQFQTLCRPMELMPVSMDLRHLLDDRVPAWSSWFGKSGISLEIQPPMAPAVVDFDPSRLGQGLDALARWRADEAPAGSIIRLAWSATGGRIQVRWDEPAPMDSGVELATIVPLALLTRVIAAHRGTIDLGAQPGLRIEMTWPIGLSVESGRSTIAAGRARGAFRASSVSTLAPSLTGR